MIIFPAIDIKNRKVVRLSQGKFDQSIEYSDDPVLIAKQWKSLGAKWLHIIDLDGAKDGKVKNLDIIIDIAKTVGIHVQTGGGIRTEKEIGTLIDAGISRVILGTKILEDHNFIKEVTSKWPGKIAVSLDCSNGFVAQKGWTETSDIKATELVKELEAFQISCFIYTDIAKDGMLSGPNWNGLNEILLSTKIPIIASGGISSIDDIKKLVSWGSNNLMGAIIGKAIYEGKIKLDEANSLVFQGN